MGKYIRNDNKFIHNHSFNQNSKMHLKSTKKITIKHTNIHQKPWKKFIGNHGKIHPE